MHRQVASSLATEAVIGIAFDTAEALRVVLTEAFETIDVGPEAPKLIVRGEAIKVFLLAPSSLFVATIVSDPPAAIIDCVDLSKATITRGLAHLQRGEGGVWWRTTWRLKAEDVEVEFSGPEGPPNATRDAQADFGLEVARAAGWPVSKPHR